MKLRRRTRRRLKIAGISLGMLAAAGLAAGVTASAMNKPAPPPLSSKVQDYYDKNVANRDATLPTVAPGKKVAFIGDSFTAGSGTTAQSMRWTTRLALSEGWEEINLGRGGSGYLITNTTPQGVVRPNFRTMIAEAVKAKPDVVFVSGGQNDLALDSADVLPAVREFYPALRKALPKAQIIAVGPLWGATELPAEMAELKATVKAAATGVGGTFLDIGQPLVNHPELVIEDKVHPNDNGAGVIAQLTEVALEKSPVAASLKG